MMVSGLDVACKDEYDPDAIDATSATSWKDDEDDEHEQGPTNVLDASMTTTRTLVSDLHSHLNNQEISDVSLRGTDGKSVVAVRSILAMRSRFFKSLFFGRFQERDMNEVPLGYSSLVLKAVVEYCYTDEIKTTFENLSFEETARSMVGLVAAGNYFELDGLMSRAYRLTCLMMDEYPALACAVLDEAVSSDGGLHTAELSRVALGIIRLRSESALLPPDTYGLGVQSLGAVAMERVMADDKIHANELSLFHCLKKWAAHVPPGTTADSHDISEERRSVARQLASRMDFSKIAPSDLSTVVAESGLVPLELLLKAYQTQALCAERKGMVFSQMRVNTVAMTGRVMVQGAGLSATNGTYVSCHSWHHPLRYTRNGTLPGYGTGQFVLHTCVLQDDTKKWFLSFVHRPPHQDNGKLDLYSAPVLSEMDPPPMQKWLSVTPSHEKLRMCMARNHHGSNQKKAHTSFCSAENDDGGVGDPPPICIWLPHESGELSKLQS